MNEDSPPPGATAAAGDRDDGRRLAPHRGWIVVVLNYQGQADTLECLRSLRAGGCPDRAILVVDNASGGDDARVIAERFPAVPLLALDTNGGFAGGNNRGFLAAKAAGARHVLFLNNDTVVEDGFLDALADFAEGRPDAAVFVPKICWYHQPDRIWFGGGRFSYWTARASTAS